MEYTKYMLGFLFMISSFSILTGQVLLESHGGLKIGSTSITGDGIIRFQNGEYEAWKNNMWLSLFTPGPVGPIGPIGPVGPIGPIGPSGGFWLENGDHIYSSNSSNVGIGINNPTQKLEVIGKIKASFNNTSSEFIEIHHGGGNGYINTVGDGYLDFRHDGNNMMRLTDTGKLIIGSVPTPGDYNLYVENGILTEEVKVALNTSSDWSDDAFYNVPKIDLVESTIQEYSHLYGMPSAQELVAKGYSVTDMDSKLLAQIEWQWMYMIEVKKENKELKERIEKLERLLIEK